MWTGNSFAKFALAGVVSAGGVTQLSAADWADRDYDSRDLRHDYRDVHHDYARANALEADIARDRARLDEDIRRGNQGRASRDAADLARDQRALDALRRDIRHDQRDLNRDYYGRW
jgi:hypothetical protein